MSIPVEPKRKRVRQSCVPCRANKTRCDGQDPCDPCINRGIRQDCYYALTERQLSKRTARNARPDPSSSDEAWSAPPGIFPNTIPRAPTLTSGHPPPASTYDRGQRTSLHHDSSRIASGTQHPGENTSTGLSGPSGQGSSTRLTPAEYVTLPEDTERWQYLLQKLPGRITCEILLEYVLQECDAIVHLGDILAIWHRCIAQQACSAADAGQMCAALSLSAHLLKDLPFSYYQPPLRPGETLATLHTDLFALSRSFMPEGEITTLDEMEHLLLVQDNLVHTGAFAESVGTIVLNERAVVHLGLMDENMPQWSGLSNELRERRRRAWAINLRNFRYVDFEVGGDFLPRLRINTCRPIDINIPVAYPIRLDLQRDVDRAQEDLDYSRVHRIKSKAERAATNCFLDVFNDLLTEFSPRIRLHLLAVHEKTMSDTMVMAQGRTLLHDLRERQTHEFAAKGFGVPRFSTEEKLSVTQLRNLSQRLWLHLFALHLEANILRPWVASRKNQELADLLLQNALETATIPGIFKHLAETGLFSFQTGLLTVPYFNAAATLMTPLLQDVRDRANLALPNLGEDPLLYMRETHFPLFRGHQTGRDLRGARVEPEKQQACAQSVLNLLEGLRAYGIGALGKDVSEKINILVERYSIRDRIANDLTDLMRERSAEPIGQGGPPPLPVVPSDGNASMPVNWANSLLDDQLFYDIMTQSITYWDAATASRWPYLE